MSLLEVRLKLTLGGADIILILSGDTRLFQVSSRTREDAKNKP